MKHRLAIRADGVDALRALALMPVVVVNLSGYAALPTGGPMAALLPADSGAAWLAAVLVATFLQGKGIALLMFLFGYSLVLGSGVRRRVDRLMTVGLLHGFLLYCGDILSTYAACGYGALRHRRGSLGLLWWRVRLWLFAGTLLLGVFSAAAFYTAASGTEGALTQRLSLSTPQPFLDWWLANAKQYGVSVFGTVFVFLPFCYAVVLGGVLAGRLRLLHHRRWREHWQHCARLAPWMLALNLVYGVAMASLLRDDVPAAEALAMVQLVLGPLTVMAWAPWLLLRPLPRALSATGRNTLSMYVGSSIVAVAVLSGVGLAWRPGTVVGTLFAVLVWLALAGWSVRAARAGRRLPLEAWVAGRSTPR